MEMGGDYNNNNNIERTDRCACASPQAGANYIIRLLEELLEMIVRDYNGARSTGAVNVLKNKNRINIGNEKGHLLQAESNRIVQEKNVFRGENKNNEGKTEALSGLRDEVLHP
ncbi:unnamed protein product [Polarella glacialis]|uniref:Uncharacterized protein n=1 Tax=Polarella glacialis TaxID=89957 RepID=A0A813LHL2_POLGL|nr:unnamed protein product [Polarella glacialis]